jgi:hypothetical protein
MARGPCAALVVCVLALPTRADAHRLDEYLQATRVSVGVDVVDLEIDLSPGVSIAEGVISTIDTDADGVISGAEADAYAGRLLGALRLAVDGQQAQLRLQRRAFPSIDDMRQGIGTIRVAARARVEATSGRRHLAYANTFLPASSVYLVNALLPADRRVDIASQSRDVLQRTFTLEYDVASSHTAVGWSAAALVMLACLAVRRRFQSSARAAEFPA